MKLNEKQGISAGLVVSAVLTGVNTAMAAAEDRTQTLLATLGVCIIVVATAWFIIRKNNAAPDRRQIR